MSDTHNPPGYLEIDGVEYVIGEAYDALLEASKEKDKRIEELMKIVMEVSTKHPGETRAETALRYIRERENQPCSGPHSALRGEGDDNA